MKWCFSGNNYDKHCVVLWRDLTQGNTTSAVDGGLGLAAFLLNITMLKMKDYQM